MYLLILYKLAYVGALHRSVTEHFDMKHDHILKQLSFRINQAPLVITQIFFICFISIFLCLKQNFSY